MRVRASAWSATVLLAASLACAEAEQAEAPRAETPPPAAPAEPCPAADFAAFYAAFAEDTLLQRLWTAFPLERRRIVDGDPEPTLRLDTLAAGEASFPLVPSASVRAADGRLVAIANVRGGLKKATVHQPDTDWVIDFIFSPDAGCWRLVRIEDWSL